MTWMNALARLIACPIVVAIGDYLFAGLRFAAPVQWIAVGLVMAIISIALDAIFLDRLGLLGSSLLYTVVAAGIVRLTPTLMPLVETNRTCSVGLGVLLGLVHLATHWWLFGVPRVVRGRRVNPNG